MARKRRLRYFLPLRGGPDGPLLPLVVACRAHGQHPLQQLYGPGLGTGSNEQVAAHD